MFGDDEVPERDSESIPTDLTITETTISSNDLGPVNPKPTSARKGRSDRRHAKYEQNETNSGGGGDRRASSSTNQRILAEKYDALLTEVNEIRVTQVAKVTTLEAEVKLGAFELKRAEQQIKSLQSQLDMTLKEKSEACTRVENLREELNTSMRASDLQVCNLTMSLHEKSAKLQMYEKIQAKIDHVLFPDLPVPDSAVGDTDEGVLSNFGYGNISIDAKMKLQQSLDLAKRLASERDHLEKSRGETQIKLHEVEKRYHDLLIEMNQLKLSDKYQTSELQSELKLKKFELGRLNILYTEMDGKFKDMLLEKERLAEKLDSIQEEYSNLKSASEKEISGLTLQLQEKSIRLEIYDRLESELDKVIVHSAALPDQHADEILSAYGYGTSVPSNMKRRLEQSLRLARRVLELENLSAEQKRELFTARDRNIILKQELETAQEAIKLSGHSTSELLQIIQKRDLSIIKLQGKIKELELSIKRLSSSNLQLQGKITHLSQLVDKSSSSVPIQLQSVKKPISCLQKRSNPTSSQSTIKSNQSTSSPSRFNSKAFMKRVSFRTYQRGSDSSIILPVTYKKVSDTSSESYLHLKKPLSFTKMSYNEQ